MRLHAARAALAALALVATGCLNTNLGTELSTSTGTVGNPLGRIPSRTGGVVLSRVVRTPTDPASSFDLVGDGGGSMGASCASTSNTNDGTGASTCTCEFRYTTTGGVQQSVQAASTYREANLLRCRSDALPDEVDEVRVRIFVSTTSSYSNEVVFRTAGNGVTLDLSDPVSFAEVKRYQCKDSLFVPYLFTSSSGDVVPYDPILSEDPKLSYPLNFYAANLGGAIASFVKTQAENPQPDGAGWNCPAKPNDPSYGMDLRVFSLSPDPEDGSRLIHDPRAQFNRRASFHLAKNRTGVFRVPVRAQVAPNATEIIGWGAAPVPRAGGTGESCSNLPVQIPSGYRWVKVWNFRGSLEDRKLPRSNRMAQSTARIWCGPTSTFSGGTAVNSECGAAPAASTRILGIDPVRGMCLQQSNVALPCVGGQGIGCTTDGVTDPANPAQYVGTTPVTTSSGSFTLNWQDLALGTDVYFRLATAGAGSCRTNFDQQPAWLDACNMPQDEAVLHDRALASVSLDGNIPRFDHLFVVSPETVMVNDFRNDTEAAKPYTPYRFYTASYCQSSDPANPAPGDCLRQNTINYGFTFHDITQPGDGTGTDPGRLPAFPVCALQPL